MSSSTAPEPVLVFGEVQTCLIQNQRTLTVPAAVDLMRLTPGAPDIFTEVGVVRALSPEQVTGVDCRLAVAREGKARGIGTVLSRAVATGGRILQGSSHAQLHRTDATRRQPWRHYLRALGTVEVIGWPEPANMLDGFLADERPARGIDLSSISDRIIEVVQLNPKLDHQRPLVANTGTVRWAAELRPGAAPSVGIRKVGPDKHVIRFGGAPGDLLTLIRFGEEYALHEWLLTTVRRDVVERAEREISIGRDPGRDPGHDPLWFALNELVPLWRPPTRVDEIKSLWKGVEDRTNLTESFRTQEKRVRDLREQLKHRPLLRGGY